MNDKEALISLASKMPPDLMDAFWEEIWKEEDKKLPALKYGPSELESDSDAEKFIKTWINGKYSVSSLEIFLNNRFLHLYINSKMATSKLNDRLELLNHLFDDPSFNQKIHDCRKVIGLSEIKPPKIRFKNYDAAANSLRTQCKRAGVDTDKAVDIILRLAQDLKLHFDWIAVIIAQVAAPEEKQEEIVKGIITPHLRIKVNNTLFITIDMQPGMQTGEWELLKKTLKPILKMNKKIGAEDIWDYIRIDRDNKVSWGELSKKYGRDIDGLKKHLKYNKQKDHEEPSWSVPFGLLGI